VFAAAVAGIGVAQRQAVTGLLTLSRDIRFGIRSLARQPGMSCAAIATLALGIGSVSVLSSVVEGVLLRPLPYPGSGSLVELWERRPLVGRERGAVSPADFYDWALETGVFESMAAASPRVVNLGRGSDSGGSEPVRVEAARVSGDYFRVLQAAALRGRTLEPGDDEPGAPPVVVLSQGLSRRLFATGSDSVSGSVVVDGVVRTVVGVLPHEVALPRPTTELWIPLALDEEEKSLRALHYLFVLGRLRPEVTLDQARERMEAVAARLEREHRENTGHRVSLVSLKDDIVAGARPAISALSTAAGLVLLIACANVANLLLARTAGRGRELGLRMALGAGRSRLALQLLTESLVLALASGLAGTLVSAWGVDVLRSLPPSILPRAGEIRLDASVLGFTLAITLASGILFGTAPAFQISRIVGLGDRSITTPGLRLRRLLVVGQVALALVLAVGALLLTRSLERLLEVDPGFHRDRLLTAGVSLPETRYPSPEARAELFGALRERVAALPGVAVAATITAPPLTGPSGGRNFHIEGEPPALPGQGHNASFNLVTPGAFRALGIPLLRGRDFTERDGIEAPGVLVVNEAMARRFWPDRDPLGARIEVGDEPLRTVVGIVGDVRQSELGDEPLPQMFWPQLQSPAPYATLAVRTTGDPLLVLPAIRQAVREVDPELPLGPIATGEELVAGSLASRKLPLSLAVLLAGAALALAAIGLAGVLSYAVSLRVREIGLRLALGATRGDVGRLVLGEAISLLVAGVVVGVIASFFATPSLSHLLYGVSASDAGSFVTVAAILFAVGLLASALPARRATRVDPMVALREN
jgi:putative ABC transport system permease protein